MYSMQQQIMQMLHYEAVAACSSSMVRKSYYFREMPGKNKQTEHHEIECYHRLNGYERLIFFVFFVKKRFFLPDFSDCQQHAVVKTVDYIIYVQSVPEAHYSHVYHERARGAAPAPDAPRKQSFRAG